MNAEDILKYLNNVDHWYLSRNKYLSVVATRSINPEEYVIYKVDAMGTSSASVAFSALENVMSAMEMPGIIMFYCIQGVNGSIQYYYGISTDTTYNMDPRTSKSVLLQASMAFEAVYSGNFPNNQLTALTTNEKSALAKSVYDYCYAAVLEGVPGQFDTSSKVIGANNVNNAMSGDNFLVIELARPLCLALDNQISCNIEAITSQLQPLANRTENCVQTDTQNNSFNVNQGNFCSNSLIKGNTEIRREYRFSDVNNTTGAVPATGQMTAGAQSNNERSTQSSATNTSTTKTPTTNVDRVNDLEDAIFEDEFEGTAPELATLVNDDLLEDEGLQPMQIENREDMHIDLQTNTRKGRRRKRMQPLRMQAIRGSGNQNTAVVNQAKQHGLAAPNLPVGTTLASQLVGGNLPLIDGDFLISDIERQISLSNSNTLLHTKSENISATKTNIETKTRSSTRNISNRNASSWVQYNENLLYKRLDVGKSQGLFLYTSGIFADSNVTLIKLSAVLKYTYNASEYNKIPVIMTNLANCDLRLQAFCNFQIPEYIQSNHNLEFSQEEILLRSNFSQCLTRPVAFGANWLSSKELGSIFAVPQTLD